MEILVVIALLCILDKCCSCSSRKDTRSAYERDYERVHGNRKGSR